MATTIFRPVTTPIKLNYPTGGDYAATTTVPLVEVQCGDDAVLHFVLRTNDAAVDLTDWELTFYLWQSQWAADPTFYYTTTAGGVAFVNAPAGYFTVTLPAADTRTFLPGARRFAITARTPDGQRVSLARSFIEALPEVYTGDVIVGALDLNGSPYWSNTISG